MPSTFLIRFRRAASPLLLILLALLTPAQRATAQAYNSGSTIFPSRPDWMRWIPDSTSLAALSLPGTHDTMANDTEWYVTGIERGWVLAQSLELRPQLDAGIRVLDIRARHIDDRFTIHHGAYYLIANFDAVMETAVQFLRDNPSETILMRIKSEHSEQNCSRSFNATFEWYRNVPAYSSFIWRQGYIPALGEVRGKIVILDDFASGQYGIPWFALNTQDTWDAANPGSKWDLVRNHLLASNGGGPSDMYVNFLSASNYSYNPSNFANSVNASALNYLAAGNVQRTGVMMMDFPGSGLIDTIVTRNSPYIPYTLPPHGGYGGTPVSTRCLYGYVAVGIHGRSGQNIDRLGLICRQLNADRSLGTYYISNSYGGSGGGYFEVECARGTAIVGIEGFSGSYINGMFMTCATPATWGRGTGIDFYSRYIGGNVGSYFSEQCTSGSVVTGFNLRVGGLVDQMQTFCSKLQ